jgi:site-specific DNA recombinase
MPTTTPPRLAAVYARVSTEEQTHRHVASTEVQVEKCREKAKELGIPVADDTSGLIVEEQHSGADLRWEGTKFMALVRRAEAGEFTDLFCYDLDRFCRGGSDAYGAQRGLFIGAGVRLHFVSMDFDERNPFAGGMAALFADVAQYERDKIRERTMRGRTAIAARGDIISSPFAPFGFRWVESPTLVTSSGRPRKVALEPDPITGPALLHITAHVANGGSLNAAQRWLIEQGLVTPRGGSRWHLSAIRRILHNPTNYGARRSLGTQMVERSDGARRPVSVKRRYKQVPRPVDEQYPVKPAYVTPIPGLTQDLWQRALDQLAQNQAFSLRNAHWTLEERTSYALLRGPMIRCAICGHAMTLARDNKVPADEPQRYHYLCAHLDTAAKGSGHVVIAAPRLDALVWESARECVRDPAFFQRILAESDVENAPAVRAASLTRQLHEATRARDKLLTQLERLDPDDDLVEEYQAKLRVNKAMREELQRDLDAAHASAHAEEARRATLRAFTRLADAERDKLDAYTPLQRHRLLRALGTRAVVGRGRSLGRVTITFDLRGLPAGAATAFSEPHLPADEVTQPRSMPEDTTPFIVDFTDVPTVSIVASEAEPQGDGDGDCDTLSCSMTI